MITIIDNELGNIKSISNMLKKIGVVSNIVKNPNDENIFNKIILPGVGSFDHGMEKLVKSGWDKTLSEKIQNGSYLMGICLGMQLLFEKSEEGKLFGLGLIPGKIVKFNFEDNKYKIPHMGWNNVNYKPNSTIVNNLSKEERYYFVHSYHVLCDNDRYEIGNTTYGYNFTSAVQNDRIYGVQFHPEKSHKFGMRLLTNFAKL
jgi:glutamine amidotransferase